MVKWLILLYWVGICSLDWVKLRFLRFGEFVVVGWEVVVDCLDELSSFIFGCYVDGVLIFVGKVGSWLDGCIIALFKWLLVLCLDCFLLEVFLLSLGWRLVYWV